MARPKESTRRYSTEVLAHRGLSGRAPENTLTAFELAVQGGADRLEFDVLLSGDGFPVVIHDATLDRTTSGRGPVGERSFAEIRRLDAGSWFEARFSEERVPTLDEVLRLSQGRIAVNVEIKEEAVARDGERGAWQVEHQVLEALLRHDLLDTAIVSSFEPLSLKRLRALEPSLSLETLYNVQGRPPGAQDLEFARSTGSKGLNISKEELAAAPGIVAKARELEMGIKVYTVDDPSEWRRLLELGVAGIFTNFADDLARVVRSAPSGL